MKLEVFPLYKGLHRKDIMNATLPGLAKHRKVVIATDFAESTVSIDGIAYVIDCGLIKLNFFSPAIGGNVFKTLPTTEISAIQRKSRAGRTKPGKCFRLYTAQDKMSSAKDTLSEITR
jgi:ATP-dependent RNA helicase DDX35